MVSLPFCLSQQGTIHRVKFCHSSAYRLAGTDSIRVISIADTVTAMRNCSQPPAVLPGKLVTVR